MDLDLCDYLIKHTRIVPYYVYTEPVFDITYLNRPLKVINGDLEVDFILKERNLALNSKNKDSALVWTVLVTQCLNPNVLCCLQRFTLTF